MKEYEYSFKVKDIKPYIDYCEKNNYKLISENRQIRELYRSQNKILARITTKINDSGIEKLLDFKDDNNTDDILKVSRETIPLIIKDDNIDAVNSILEILGYKKDKILNRTRVVYQKEGVKFELDSYVSPDIMFVVGIEGENEKVDNIYKEVVENIHNKI